MVSLSRRHDNPVGHTLQCIIIMPFEGRLQLRIDVYTK
jgi:hypothetical protein